MRFTLDTNGLIDVEEARADAPYIRELVSRQGNGLTVAVSAIGASERQRNGGYAQSFSDFQQKLNAFGFGGLEILPQLAYMDICFWDHCVIADEADTLERDIHDVLFPSNEFLWIEYASARGLPVDAIDKNRRNAKCDALGL